MKDHDLPFDPFKTMLSPKTPTTLSNGQDKNSLSIAPFESIPNQSKNRSPNHELQAPNVLSDQQDTPVYHRQRSREKNDRGFSARMSSMTSAKRQKQCDFQRMTHRYTPIQKRFSKFIKLPDNRYSRTNRNISLITNNELIQILLSYNYTHNICLPLVGSIPIVFKDGYEQYRQKFSQSLINEVITDVHNRMKTLQFQNQYGGNHQSSDQQLEASIPITIKYIGASERGFIPIFIEQRVNSLSGHSQLRKCDRQRYELVIISNHKYFKMQHYGLSHPDSNTGFAILCLIALPEEQAQNKRNKQLKIYGYFNRIDFQRFVCDQGVFSKNRTKNYSKLLYLHQIDKISSQVREYDAIVAINQSPLNHCIYDPIKIKNFEDAHDRFIDNRIKDLALVIENRYNSMQSFIIKDIFRKQKGIFMVQGPPGTGKTTTLLGLLSFEYHHMKYNREKPSKNHKKILICAPSNSIIDHITKLIIQSGLVSTQNQFLKPRILRVGGYQSQKRRNKKQKKIEDLDLKEVNFEYLRNKWIAIEREKEEEALKTQTQKKLEITELQKRAYKLRRELGQQKEQSIRDFPCSNSSFVVQSLTVISYKSDQQLHQEAVQSEYDKLQKEINRKIQQLESCPPRLRLSFSQITDMVENKLLTDAEIILTTLNSSGLQKVSRCLKDNVSCLIIDEAVQATQPSILVPMSTLCDKMLLIGDPYQLPSMILSKNHSDSKQRHLDRSLFQRMLDCLIEPYFLTKQYRMAPLIRQFPSLMFYQDKLEDDQTIPQRYNDMPDYLKSIHQFLHPSSPLNSLFIDLSQSREEQCQISKSYKNQIQANLIIELLVQIIRFVSEDLSIGIISPYNQQVKFIKNRLRQVLKQRWEAYNTMNKHSSINENPQQSLKQEGEISEDNLDDKSNRNQAYDNYDRLNAKNKRFEKISISTVDAFQGKQCDIVIVSTVRAGSVNGQLGFIKDFRRINVALTRARHLLFTIGNFESLYRNSASNEGIRVFQNLLNWHIQKKSLFNFSGQSGEQMRAFIKKIWNRQEQPYLGPLKYLQSPNKQVVGFQTHYHIISRQQKAKKQSCIYQIEKEEQKPQQQKREQQALEEKRKEEEAKLRQVRQKLAILEKNMATVSGLDGFREFFK